MTQQLCSRCQTPRVSAENAFCTNCGTPFAAVPDESPTLVVEDAVPGDPQGGWAPPSGTPQDPAQWGAPTPGAGPVGAPGGQWGPPPGGPTQWSPTPAADGGGGRGGRIALIVGLVVLLLVIGGVVAALVVMGDDDKDDKPDGADSPTSASQEEFCAGWDRLLTEVGDVTADQASLDGAKDLIDELEDIGTPEGIPAEARKGFEAYVEMVDEIDTVEDAKKAEDSMNPDTEGDIKAFFAYYFETCTDLPSGLPSEAPTDSSSETPSGLPSDFPTEFPTDLGSLLPSELLSMLPSDLSSLLPSGFDPSDFGLSEDDLAELQSMLSELAKPQ